MNRCEECEKKPLHPDKKCCFNCARSDTNCEVWHNCGEDCPGWDERKMTNADRIRAMSDDEQKDFILAVHLGYSPWCDNHCENNGDDGCDLCIGNWLQQPAEEMSDNA